MGARGVRRGRPVVARLCLDAFPGARRWQNAREMRSPGVRRWRDCALMRSWPDWQWQYSRAMRSRVSIRGKIPPRCVPGRQSVASFALHASRKWPRTGKSPVRGKIRAPCIRNELALAGYARHASEKPRKPPSEDTPREDLARKDPFSLHGPLESCTARESCHPASTKRPSARNPCAADQRQTARAPATPAPPNSTEQHEPPTTTPPPSWQRTTHSIRGASGSHTANAPTPHRPATLRRQADVKSCAARAPQRQSATRGQPRRKRSRTPHQRQRPALQWRASARCRSKAQRGSLAANLDGCPQRQTARTPHARITSSLRRDFASFRRRRAPTIHIYPPLLWRGFPADAPRTAAFPYHPGECRSAPCACHGVPDRNRLPSAPRQCGKHGNP